MTLHRATTVALLAVLFALSLTGCSGDQRAEEKNESLLRRGNVEHPATLDPALANDVHTFNVLFDLYEGLVSTDAAGNLIPGVATSWDQSDDGLRYTFKLRNDAKWSDGSTVTARQFVDAFQRAANPDTVSEYGFLLSAIENFDAIASNTMPVSALGVRAPSDDTLIIELKRPGPEFLSILTMPVAFPLHEKGKAAQDFGDPATFVGNGAYVLSANVVGRPVVLHRNPEYWDAANTLIERVEYHAIAEPDTEYRTFQSGDLEVTAGIPAARFAE